jgi:hypothetical protein
MLQHAVRVLRIDDCSAGRKACSPSPLRCAATALGASSNLLREQLLEEGSTILAFTGDGRHKNVNEATPLNVASYSKHRMFFLVPRPFGRAFVASWRLDGRGCSSSSRQSANTPVKGLFESNGYA